MDTQVQSARPFQVLSLLLVLLASALAGCADERSALPLTPVHAQELPSRLTLWVDGTKVATFEQRETIEQLCSMLPPRDYELLFREGSCTTTDAGFKAAVIESLERDPEVRRGFSGGLHDVSWGEIKLLFG